MNASEWQINKAYDENIVNMWKNLDYNIKTWYFIYKKSENNKKLDKYYNKKIIWFEWNCNFVRESDKEVDEKRKIVLKTSYKIAYVISNNEASFWSLDLEDFIHFYFPKFIFNKKDSLNAEYIYEAINRIDIIKEECSKFLEKNSDCNFTKAVYNVIN